MNMYMKLTDFQPSQRRFTEQGYMIVPAKLARVGIMEYDGSEIGQTDGQTYRVNRYEEDVFAPAAIASFEGLPFTYIHPDEDVDAENWAEHVKGYIKNVHRDGDYLAAEVWVCDAETIRVIVDEKVEELSCGYASQLEPDTVADFKQTHIRGNHVALVPRGRAGSECRIGDSEREKMPQLKPTFLDKFFAGLGLKVNDQQRAAAELMIKARDSETKEGENKDNDDPNADPEKKTDTGEPEKKPESEQENKDNDDPQAIIAALQAQLEEKQTQIDTLEGEKEEKEEAQIVAADALKIVPSIAISSKDSARVIREKAIAAQGIETRENMKTMKDADIHAIYMGMKYNRDSGLGRAMLNDAAQAPKKVNYNDMYRKK